MERFFSDWVRQCPEHRLTVCKRCGPTVTRFVSETFDFAEDFTFVSENNPQEQ